MPDRNLFASLAGAAALCVMAGLASAQDLSKYQDWSGQWKRTSGIQWDPSKPLGPAQKPPLTPEYQARYEANLRDQAAGGQGGGEQRTERGRRGHVGAAAADEGRLVGGRRGQAGDLPKLGIVRYDIKQTGEAHGFPV